PGCRFQPRVTGASEPRNTRDVQMAACTTRRSSNVRSLLHAVLVFVAAGPAAGSGVARASAAARSALTVRSTRYGSILSDGRGFALYAFTRDRRGGSSRCYGACAKAWPVYFAGGRLVAGKGVKRALLGTTRRRH